MVVSSICGVCHEYHGLCYGNHVLRRPGCLYRVEPAADNHYGRRKLSLLVWVPEPLPPLLCIATLCVNQLGKLFSCRIQSFYRNLVSVRETKLLPI